MRRFIQVGLDKAMEELVERTVSLLAHFGWHKNGHSLFRMSPTRIIQDLYEKGRVDDVWDRGLRYVADPGLSRREKFHIITYLRSAAYQRGNKDDLARIREELKRVAGEEYDGKLAAVFADRHDMEDGRPDKVLALLCELREKGVALNSLKQYADALAVHWACLRLALMYMQIPGFPDKDEIRRIVRIASHNVGDTAINLIRSSVQDGNLLGPSEFLQLLGAERFLNQSLEIQEEEGREWGLTHQSLLQSMVLRSDYSAASEVLEHVLGVGNPLASELCRILDGHPEEVEGLESDPECAVKLESLRALANGVVGRTARKLVGPMLVMAGGPVALTLLVVFKAIADNM